MSWTYFGILVSRTGVNGSGMRWYALTTNGRLLADSKESMRELIRKHIQK